jgi:hypothetical protein
MVVAYDWSDLRELARWHIKPLDDVVPDVVEEKMSGLAQRTPSIGRVDLPDTGEPIDQVIVSQTKEHILLLSSQQSLHRRRRSRLRIIDIASLTKTSSEGRQDVTPIPIPRDIATVIERPLQILGKDRLVFLDDSFWVCTWRLTHLGGANGMVRHFFLPRDWVNPGSLELCMVMADGTFLCPRKGEVAIIKSNLGSDW